MRQCHKMYEIDKHGNHAPRLSLTLSRTLSLSLTHSHTHTLTHSQEGGMRTCHKMYEIDKHGNHAPGVAKIFKDDVTGSRPALYAV